MANLQQIANCLVKAMQGNTASIKQATQQLQYVSKGDNFIQNLLAIPQMQGVSKQLARFAIIYCLTYARNIVLWRNQSAINIAAQSMYDFIANNKIDLKHKDQIAAALQYLIQKDHNNVIVSAFIPNMIEIFRTAINCQANQINYQFIGLISQALVEKVTPATGGQVQRYIQHSYIGLCYLINKLLKLVNDLPDKNQDIMQKVLILVTKMLKILKKYMRKFMFFDAKLTVILHSPLFLQMINSTLNFNFPQNKLQIPIFYYHKQIKIPNKLLQYFHAIKSLTIFILTQAFRIIISTNNLSISIQSSQVIKQIPNFITAFVNSIINILQQCPYYKLNSKSKYKTIQQIYNFLIAILRSGRYYKQMNQIRPLVLYSCIFKTLAFTPQDIKNYYQNPQQFINSLFHIVDLDAGLLANNQKSQMNDQHNHIQIYDTLKTHTANLLSVYIKYIDCTLAQLICYIINVIDDKINLQASKNLMFLLLCIMRDSMKFRNDLLAKIKVLIFQNLKNLQLPTSKQLQPYNIQYTMNLFTLNRFLILFDSINDDTNTIQKSFCIAQQLLNNNNVQKPAKIIASQIILTLLNTEQSSFYSRRTINLLMEIVNFSNLNIRYLQCLQEIIKENDYVFEHQYTVLITMLEKLSVFLLQHITQNNKDVEIIAKIWHIFQQITQSKVLSVSLAPTVKRVIQPFINMINGDNQIQMQQKVYMLMENIIKKTGQVGQYQVQIITALHKTFYKGQKKRSLSNSFSLLQLILLHGKQVITANIIVIQNIILLAIQSINSTTVNEKPRLETDCLEGILVLQSLIITSGQYFNKQIWVTITNCLVNKLKNHLIVYDFVKAAIISTLSLVLSMAYNHFSAQNNEQLMQQILKLFDTLIYPQPRKIVVITFSNILQNFSVPFVYSRFSQILDLTITLLKLLKDLKQIAIDESQQDSQQKNYNKIMKKVRNYYENIDQFEYFKSIINDIKQKNKQILEKAFTQLIQTKRNFMKELLNMRKINNNARVIYKVKQRNQIENNNTQM